MYALDVTCLFRYDTFSHISTFGECDARDVTIPRTIDVVQISPLTTGMVGQINPLDMTPHVRSSLWGIGCQGSHIPAD